MMRKKILIIDDDEVDRMSIARLLGDEMFEFSEAINGEDGIKKAEEVMPDIVIVDTNLGLGIDGFETCQKIKQIDGIETKIIVTTGNIDAVDAIKARKMGADDYCVKVTENKELLEVVNQLLEK